MHPTPSSIRQILIWLLLPLVVTVAFWPATHHEFINYDDPTYVLNNQWIQRRLSPASVRWAFTTGYAANWHPLTWISHMVDCQLFGLRPRGHHLTSVILHALNTLLVFLALRKLTGSTWRSLSVALLFGLHPLRAESVAWVAERKDVLSTFFWLATLWAYAEWVEFRTKQQGTAWWFYALALVCLALGLMSKAMLVTLPFVLLLLDYWPLRRLRPEGRATFLGLVVEKLPFFVLAVTACVITFIVQPNGGAVKSTEIFPLQLRIGNAILSYSEYLWKFFYPVHLAVFYPHPGNTISWGAVLFSAAFLLSVSGVAFWQRRAQPWLIVGWLWYLGTLVPTIGIVQVGAQAMADRYTYVPLLGFAVALVWTAHEIATRRRISISVQAVGALASVTTCAMLTQIQIGYWRNSETLFRHALAVTEKNTVAHVNLGIALDEKGASREAIGELEAALKITPDSSAAHLNLGILLKAAGQTDEAVQHLLQATRLEPNSPEGYFCLADALYQQRKLPEAITAYQRTLSLNPDHAQSHLKLGSMYFELNSYPKALSQFQEYLRLKPDSADGNNDVGSTLFAEGRLGEAIPFYERALSLQPNHEDARRNLEALRAAMAVDPQH